MESKQVLEKLKKSRILSIQDYDKIQPIDRGAWALVDAPVNAYDRVYPKRLKEFLGLDIVIVRSMELFKEIGEVKRKEAGEIADKWINEAEEVKNVTKEDVVKSAEIYLAYRKLMKKYDANAITMSSWALIPDGKLKAMPPLSEMELAKNLIPSCCESLIDPLVTQMIGTYVSGRPGFVGDAVNEWGKHPEPGVGVLPGLEPIEGAENLLENVVVIGHCYGPINPHGNDRVPYVIRDHVVYNDEVAKVWMKSWKEKSQKRAFKQLKKEHITLVGITVKFPIEEIVTIVKFNVYDKKAFVSTGTAIDGGSLFKDFSDRLCRTKISIKTDKPFRNEIGGHLVVFYGDYKQEFKDFAKLIGFEVIEKDK